VVAGTDFPHPQGKSRSAASQRHISEGLSDACGGARDGECIEDIGFGSGRHTFAPPISLSHVHNQTQVSETEHAPWQTNTVLLVLIVPKLLTKNFSY
jgi:hypothetical protein